MRTQENVPYFVLLVGISLLLFFVFAPFLNVLGLAAVFAILLYRPFEHLSRSLSHSPTLGALATVLLMLMLCVLPLFFLGAQITKEAQYLYTDLQGNGVSYIQTIQTTISHFFPGFGIDLKTYIGNGYVFIADHLGSFLYQTLYLIFSTFIMLLTLFFFLRDGKEMVREVVAISPFGNKLTWRIVDALHDTTHSVVRGTLLIILIRWLSMWVAFSLFGVPNAVFWSSVGAVLGAIPGLGTAFGFVGGVLYLYLAGNSLGAVGLIALGALMVVFIDNILTSYFFGKGLGIPPSFVLFSILGGIVFFGPLGFIFGPLVLSVFLSVVRAYEGGDALRNGNRRA